MGKFPFRQNVSIHAVFYSYLTQMYYTKYYAHVWKCNLLIEGNPQELESLGSGGRKRLSQTKRLPL